MFKKNLKKSNMFPSGSMAKLENSDYTYFEWLLVSYHN